jgi:hypothetical protein
MLGNGFSEDFLRYLDFIPQSRPISNIAYKYNFKLYYGFWIARKTLILKSPTPTGRHVVGVPDLFIDVLLEVLNQNYV